MKRAGVLLCTACLTLGFHLIAPPVAAAQTPKGDLFVGAAFFAEEGNLWTGFQLSGSVNPWRHVGFVGDLTLYGENEGQQTILGGVRFYAPGSHATVFGQFLVGNAPLDDFAFQPGAGVDVHLNSRLAVRAAIDLKIAGDDGSTYLGTRFSTGLVVKLGRR